MSTSSASPPTTPAEPKTPPMPSLSVKITLPTPPSFSRRQRSASATLTSPVRTPAAGDTEGGSPPSSGSAAPPMPAAQAPEWKKSHGRSVSFNLPTVLSPISPRDVSRNGKTNSTASSPGVYRIPQRSPDYVSAPSVPSSAPSTETSNQKRRVPPRPLALSPASAHFVGTATGLSPTTRLGPMTAPAPGSRWSSTAAARGLSIEPSLAKQRHSTGGSGTASLGSIWSANLAGLGALGAQSGWISPALASARSAGAAARTRGLTVAVLNSGSEVLLETLPTPGLGRTFSDRSEAITEEKEEEMEMLKDEIASPNPVPESAVVVSPAPSSGKSDTKKPREIILCRYYHTPDLTCTSRPCRFVHDLATISLRDASIADYNMKSPTTANLPSAVTDRRAGDSPDFTSGTFAAFQAEARKKTLSIKGVDEKGILPGEKVVVAAENGEEVEGMVFLMSGGGKGPSGKGKAKFKTVPCKDFVEGHCPYGAHCSFIHDEKPAPEKLPTENPAADAPPPKSAPNLHSPSATKTETATSKADRRRSFDPSALKGAASAWRIPLKEKVSVVPDALERHKQNLSAFAPPYRAEPIEVDKKGALVPSTPGLKSSFGNVQLVVAPKELTETAAVRFKLDPPPMSRGKSSDSTASSGSKGRSAWSKGAPANLKTVTIDNTPIQAQTLTVPMTTASMFGTESDPATPWDPAVRAKKLAEAASDAGKAADEARNPEYPPTASYVTVVPDYEVHWTDGNVQGGMPYPYSAPAYPWGMPMSPVNVTTNGTYEAASAIPGGLGVMWTPTGWAVQDAAMKMALYRAENGWQGKQAFMPKAYWRTRKCKFFSEGHCPHGDSCTYIHDSSDSSDSAPSAGKPKPGKQSRKNHQTQPCKFFNSASGCLNGSACAFLHTLVVPDSAQLVDKPRPWRTRPCRHFQVGRCRLGEACHFAHVYDGSEVSAGQELRAALMLRERRMSAREDDEDSEDDLEIVTENTSTLSPPRSVMA